MHRSGFALTGAGLSLKGKSTDTVEDGIVTAEEVAGLDLWGTDLVVLSACQTALGDVKGGEGVMGLRRAFVQAGARNLVLTMWKVEDQKTPALMIDFYREYLASGDAVDAMCRAQRKMLQEKDDAGQPIHPRYWAPFILSFQGKPAAVTD